MMCGWLKLQSIDWPLKENAAKSAALKECLSRLTLSLCPRMRVRIPVATANSAAKGTRRRTRQRSVVACNTASDIATGTIQRNRCLVIAPRTAQAIFGVLTAGMRLPRIPNYDSGLRRMKSMDRFPAYRRERVTDACWNAHPESLPTAPEYLHSAFQGRFRLYA